MTNRKNETKCALCAGTGTLWAMRSWFPADGVRKFECAVCAGTGASAYRPEPGVLRDAARLREIAPPLTPPNPTR